MLSFFVFVVGCLLSIGLECDKSGISQFLRGLFSSTSSSKKTLESRSKKCKSHKSLCLKDFLCMLLENELHFVICEEKDLVSQDKAVHLLLDLQSISVWDE